MDKSNLRISVLLLLSTASPPRTSGGDGGIVAFVLLAATSAPKFYELMSKIRQATGQRRVRSHAFLIFYLLIYNLLIFQINRAREASPGGQPAKTNTISEYSWSLLPPLSRPRANIHRFCLRPREPSKIHSFLGHLKIDRAGSHSHPLASQGPPKCPK